MNLKIVPIRKQTIQIKQHNILNLDVTGGSGAGGVLDGYVATDDEMRAYFGL